MLQAVELHKQYEIKLNLFLKIEKSKSSKSCSWYFNQLMVKYSIFLHFSYYFSWNSMPKANILEKYGKWFLCMGSFKSYLNRSINKLTRILFSILHLEMNNKKIQYPYLKSVIDSTANMIISNHKHTKTD